MSKTGKIVLAIVFVVIIAAAALLLNKKDDKNSSSPSSSGNSSSSSSSGSSSGSPSDTTTAAMVITYNGNSFSESTSSIKAGESVKVVNSSSSDSLDFASDPHPVHTDNTELNIGSIEPGQSKTFTITKTGTWGFHNHLDASQHGKIVVN